MVPPCVSNFRLGKWSRGFVALSVTPVLLSGTPGVAILVLRFVVTPMRVKRNSDIACGSRPSDHRRFGF